MLKKLDKKKILLILLILVLIPIVVPFMTTLINIIYGLGVHFGTIVRCQ